MSAVDAKTLEALQASIAKWERNAVAETPEAYSTSDDDCALCQAFPDLFCDGCPVKAATGRAFCWGTPYNAAHQAHHAWDKGTGTAEDAHAAARKEVAFLKSLLPEGAS